MWSPRKGASIHTRRHGIAWQIDHCAKTATVTEEKSSLILIHLVFWGWHGMCTVSKTWKWTHGNALGEQLCKKCHSVSGSFILDFDPCCLFGLLCCVCCVKNTKMTHQKALGGPLCKNCHSDSRNFILDPNLSCLFGLVCSFVPVQKSIPTQKDKID